MGSVLRHHPKKEKTELDRYIELTQWIRELSNPRLGDIKNDDSFRTVMLRNFSRIGELSRINIQILNEYYFPLLAPGRRISEEESRMVKGFADELLDPYTLDNLDIHLVYLQLEHMLKKPPKDTDQLIRLLDDFVMVSYSMLYTAVCIYPCSDIFKKYREAGIRAAERILTYLAPEKFRTIKTDEAKESVLITLRYIRSLHEHPDAYGDKKENAADLETVRRALAVALDPFYIENAPAYDWRYHLFRTYEYAAELSEYHNARGFNGEELEEIFHWSEKAISMYESDPAYFSTISNINNLKAHHTRAMYLTGRLTTDAYKKELVRLFNAHCAREEGQPDISAVVILYDYLKAVDKANISAADAKNIRNFYHELILIMNSHARRGTLIALMYYLSHILKSYVEVPGGESFEAFCLNLMAALHPPTYVHTLSVASISAILATHLLEREPALFIGMPGCKTKKDVAKNADKIVDYIRHAALCHDFGKLLIIETIRTYGRYLLPSEMEMIRQHGSVGAYLLKQHADTAAYADIATGHHIWYDGHGGYPDDFDVEASPYKTAIAIVACADCLDAATDAVGRSYKNGKDFDGFFSELHAESGTRYAPYLNRLLADNTVRNDLEMQLAKGREENYREAFRRLKRHAS